MKKTALTLAAALALGLCATAANASTFLFQWVDGEPNLTGNTYQDGVLIQSVTVGQEAYPADYGLWNGATLVNDVVANFNIFEANGSLSDSWSFVGLAGATRIAIPFLSENVTLLPNGLAIREDGTFQTVLEFDVSNGDHYIWQFASLPDSVPEPAAWAMMLAGFGMVGFAARRRKALQAA